MNSQHDKEEMILKKTKERIKNLEREIEKLHEENNTNISK